MAIKLATGTVVAAAATYGAGFTISAISNANPAVATLSASHGVVVGDLIELNSGWDLLNGRLARVSVVSTNDVTLEGFDTSNANNYPAGSGVGTGREILTWSAITQLKDFSNSGGAINFADVTTVVDRVQKQVPTTRSAQQFTFTFFDDPTQAWYPIVRAASEANALTALRIVFPDGSRLLANGYYSLQTTPDVAVNAPLSAKLDFSAFAVPTRYAT
jgi:hypothetical protein